MEQRKSEFWKQVSARTLLFFTVVALMATFIAPWVIEQYSAIIAINISLVIASISILAFTVYQDKIIKESKEDQFMIVESDYTYGEFLDDIKSDVNIKSISAIFHTGEKSLKMLLDHLDYNKLYNKDIEVRALVRSPSSETDFRKREIINIYQKIKTIIFDHGSTIELRYYNTLPCIKYVLIEYVDNSESYYISFYDWVKYYEPAVIGAYKSKSMTEAVDYSGYNLRESKLSQLCYNWFDQLWGGSNYIHTIVFDFDDTLAFTMNHQVQAWIDAIKEYRIYGIIEDENIIKDIINNIDEEEILFEVIKNVFIKYQMAEKIINAIFVKLDQEVIKNLNDRRRDLRWERLMDDEELFDYNINKLLVELSNNYNIAIVTSTNGENVMKCIEKNTTGEYKLIPVVLGSEGVDDSYGELHAKSSQLIRVSSIMGIPLDRMVFFGDNNTDAEAARQVGTPFVEVRKTAKKCGLESLLTIENRKAVKYKVDDLHSEEIDRLVTKISNKR